MKINQKNEKPEICKTDLLILPLFEKQTANAVLDKKLKAGISKLQKEDKFDAEFKKTYIITSMGLIPSDNIMLLGMGKKEQFTEDRLRRAAGIAAKTAKRLKVNKVAFSLDFKDNLAEYAQAFTEGFVLGSYNFIQYKTEEKKKEPLIKELLILSSANVNSSLKKAQLLAETVNYVRDLVNMPACTVTPTYLANEAVKFAKKEKIKVTVLGKKELEKKGMNAILGVSKGSSQEPKLIMLETNPKAKKKIAIVGKGITFDSGGLDIKPWPYMKDMKSDMAGAAVVLGTVMIATKLKLPVNVVGIIGACENMPGPSAQKAGDIIVSYSKKTIEILNTDAEGRLVLADAVAFAEEQKPDAIIDLATLTGSCIISLGHAGAALIGTDEKLKDALKKASANTGERIWELPIWDEFREGVKGDVGDVKNLSPEPMGAGTITAATFIESFIKNTPWAHLDIAGTAWQVEEKDYDFKGGSGFGVRLLINFLENK